MLINIETPDDLAVFMETIQSQPFACIYKHSSTCGLSATAMKQVRKAHEEVAQLETHTDLMIGVVVVQTAREVSNLIAQDLEIKHESPQLLIFKKGECIDVSNHLAVSARHLLHVINGGYNPTA